MGSPHAPADEADDEADAAGGAVPSTADSTEARTANSKAFALSEITASDTAPCGST